MPEVQFQKKVNEAEKLKESVTIPDPPGHHITWNQFEKWLEIMTPDQLEGIQSYVYRTRPIIVRQQSNPENANYIDVVFGKLTREYIVSQHGGGRFNIHVTTPGNRHKNKQQLTIVTLDVPLEEAEPVLVYSELDMNARDNRAYVTKLISLGKITQDGKPMTPNQPAPGAQTVPEAMAKMQSDFMNIFMKMNESQQRQLMESASKKDELGGTVGAILIEKMKQDNPNGMLPLLIEMMKQQKSTAGDFTPIFTVVTSMMSQMATMQQENTKMLIEVMRDNKSKSSDDEDEMGKGSIFDKMKSLMEFAKEIKGGRTAEKSTLETIVDGIQVVGPPLLETVGKYLQFAMMSKGVSGVPGMQPEMPIMPALPSANQPGDIYKNGPPKVVTMQPNQSTSQPNQPQEQPLQLTSVQQVQQLIATQGPLVFQHLEESGAEFADLVIGMFGKLAWVTMSKFDEETMIAGAKLVPQFWQQVEATYGEAHLRKWITEFKNYEEILAKEGEEDDA